ncbi:ABC transporter domain-containing protein [Mycena venus]|uniref:ABC transporter domain-containing protein n=1 Tax=Mycena venus TaxID=2733690 RepID=A0A8H7CL94_9AGAR|nr:ABC transporter domain-containing protein [Mycena venus]
MPTPSDGEPGLILSLPPPKPYSLSINNLTIGAPPPPEGRIPLIIGSAPIPSFLRSKKQEDGSATICAKPSIFSAALRLPKTVDNKTVRQIVDQTIDELGLKECADTVVGGIFRKGISGGERRYVASSKDCERFPYLIAR